jgi:hypothetical protein
MLACDLFSHEAGDVKATLTMGLDYEIPPSACGGDAGAIYQSRLGLACHLGLRFCAISYLTAFVGLVAWCDFLDAQSTEDVGIVGAHLAMAAALFVLTCVSLLAYSTTVLVRLRNQPPAWLLARRQGLLAGLIHGTMAVATFALVVRWGDGPPYGWLVGIYVVLPIICAELTVTRRREAELCSGPESKQSTR